MKRVIFSRVGDESCFSKQLTLRLMASTMKKAPKPPGIAIWVLVTLLWGTVFYWTSIFMLQLASFRLQEGFFNPSGSEQWRVYGIQVVVLILFALVAMLIKNQLEPGGKKQIERWQNISEGKGEKIFISFAGSLATSFFFTALTALTFLASSGFLGFEVDLTLPLVLLAAFFNVAAGIAASLIVGFVFLIAQVGKKKD
jgi:hypothetical protein